MYRLSNEISAKFVADSVYGQFREEFDLIARALNGEKSARFGSFRVLLRRFGRKESKLLISISSQKSNYNWLLTIKPREDANRPDGGKRRRAREREFEVNEIGEVYYRSRREGLSDMDSLKAAQQVLKLNLSLRTIRAKVQEFRKAAIKRGYVDPYAAVEAARRYSKGHSIPEPDLTIADMTKKGRPLKKVQAQASRSVLLPFQKPS
jgi:hypothetical protein